MHLVPRFLLALAALVTALARPAAAEIGLSADVVSRYIFRGTDFGNAVSVQPTIAYAAGSFEVGAWSSWAVDSGGANENDLYATVALGPASLTFTDYFFPAATPADFFSYSDDAAVHVLEISAAADLGPASLLGAYNLSGDRENSFWVEASLPLDRLAGNGVEVGLTLGVGDGLYTTDTDPNLVQISLDVVRGHYFGQYILNPEAEITFLVFGRSL